MIMIYIAGVHSAAFKNLIMKAIGLTIILLLVCCTCTLRSVGIPLAMGEYHHTKGISDLLGIDIQQ